MYHTVMRVTRRGFFAAAGLWTTGCAVRRGRVQGPEARPSLARVNVAPERVIRTIAGLRPFRPSGFVVRAEKLGEKLVIHNYGHGGAGITLSWGTSQLAVEEAAKSEARDCAVIGCGVVGLSTARLLQLRGYNPVIYARETPPLTTSNVAGGLWDPVTVYDRPSVTPQFRAQLATAARFAFRRYQSLAGDEYGVRWLPEYSLSTHAPFEPAPPESPASDVEPLFPDSKMLRADEHPFQVPYVRRRYSMLIEPAIYLHALMRDFFSSGGRLEVREFHAPSELADLRETVIFNCTGLGARALFNDNDLTPIQGQLAFLLPQPEVNYMTVGPGDIYMFPRHDGVLLGGSHERGEWSTEPNQATTERILRENGILFGGMRT
jgi:D-amino-acid oxidase